MSASASPPACVVSSVSPPLSGRSATAAAAGSGGPTALIAAHHDDTSGERGTTPATGNATAQTCSTDALGLIFSFLPLEDVASSAAACRRWSTAAAAATGRQPITVTSVRMLIVLVESPLRRLVGEIDLCTTLMAADRIESLWSAFPHLTALTCTIDARRIAEDTALQFPTTLRVLDVTVPPRSDLSWSHLHLDLLLSLVVRCPLTRLRVSTPKCALPDIDAGAASFNRLLALRDTLTDLHLGVSITNECDEWRSARIAVFRSLSHLTRLHAFDACWQSRDLEVLTADPVPLRLESIDFANSQLTAPDLVCLARLPSLSSLRVKSLLCDPAMLARLPRLHTLQVDDCDQQPSHSLMRGVSQCACLTDLTLNRRMPDCLDDVATVPSSLRQLHLTRIPVDLARITAMTNLADTIETINVDKSQSLRSLLHVRSLRRLQSAHISCRLTVDESDGPTAAPVPNLTETDSETVFLPSLDRLQLVAYRIGAASIDLSRVFGRLPALRTFVVYAQGDCNLTPLLTRMTGLTSLMIGQLTMMNEDLGPVMAAMPHLRELTLSNVRDDLSFLSSDSSRHLARTLERLTIEDASRPVDPRQLRHLRSLGSLRYLKLTLQVAVPSSTSTAAESACESGSSGRGEEGDDNLPVLASLREIHLRLTGPNEGFRMVKRPSGSSTVVPSVSLALLLGPMPQLRSADIDCGQLVHAQSIVDVLAHSPRLTALTLHHPDLTESHLISALRPLTRLRSLRLTASSVGRLSFASTVSHLAGTLESFGISSQFDSPPLAECDLRHLRALTHLRTLTIFARARPEELDACRRIRWCDDEVWPLLAITNVTFIK